MLETESTDVTPKSIMSLILNALQSGEIYLGKDCFCL